LKVLVNAGPTYEAIDPVRYIGNHSTGKMGVAIAEEFSRRGAEVYLVLGPESVLPEDKHIHIVRVTSADEMLAACLQRFVDVDIAILAAAVADYKPAQIATEKIKKNTETLSLELIRTPDIATALGKIKKPGQHLVGFALETDQGEVHAREKMIRKNMDMIVLNNPRDQGAGFGHDTNKVSFLFPDNKEVHFELKSKQAVARDIAEAVHQMIHVNAKK
jgi:phosphopantothenoylcysteine decarboxylase / phosphopantothenate---cysteine ligase